MQEALAGGLFLRLPAGRSSAGCHPTLGRLTSHRFAVRRCRLGSDAAAWCVVGGVTVGWLKAGAVTTTTSRAAEVNNVVRMCIASQIEPWATGLLFPAIQYPCWGCYGRAGIVKVAERPGEIDRARAAQQLRKCICSTQACRQA